MSTSFATAGGHAIINTFFKKRTSQQVTFTSGGNNTQVDYVLCRRTGLKQVADCKVIPGECVAKQHKPVVCKAKLKEQQRVRRRTEKRTRWWKLEDQSLREDFVEKVKGRTPDGNNSWDMISKITREVAKETLGETSGKAKENRETWWWEKEVQEAIASKTVKKKGRDLNRSEETVREYIEAR